LRRNLKTFVWSWSAKAFLANKSKLHVASHHSSKP
jgi:hypothetical protein